MNDIIAITLTSLISGITLTALLTTLIYLIPIQIERASQTIEQAPGRSFLVGLVNTLFFGVLAAIFANGGEAGGLLSLLILLGLGGLSLIGVSGIIITLQKRLYPHPEKSGLKMTMKTAVLLITATLTPLFGWFVLAPILLMTGLGGAIATFVRRRRKENTLSEEHIS